MASCGRKQKAEVAVVVAAEKQEKLAGDQKEAEEATVVIEHCRSCRVYGRSTVALSQALRLEVPQLPVKVNPAKPWRDSFEVTLLCPDGSSAELWTGLKKGPPHKLKFPEPQEVVEKLKKYLS